MIARDKLIDGKYYVGFIFHQGKQKGTIIVKWSKADGWFWDNYMQHYYHVHEERTRIGEHYFEPACISTKENAES